MRYLDGGRETVVHVTPSGSYHMATLSPHTYSVSIFILPIGNFIAKYRELLQTKSGN